MAALSITVAILHTYRKQQALYTLEQWDKSLFSLLYEMMVLLGTTAAGAGREGGCPAASLHFLEAASTEQPLHLRQPFLHRADLRGYHLKAMFSSSVWTAVFCGPSHPPISCTPHSSSGFAILFSAASCTKLCCDCAVGLDMAKRIQRSPFSSYQTTL